jgi:hypothetical protein
MDAGTIGRLVRVQSRGCRPEESLKPRLRAGRKETFRDLAAISSSEHHHLVVGVNQSLGRPACLATAISEWIAGYSIARQWHASAPGFGLDSCGPPEPVEVDSGLPAGGFLPVGNVRERLGKKRTKDDDVEGGDVRPDGAVLASSLQDAPEGVADLSPEGDCVRVEEHGAAVQREHEVATVVDGLVDEASEAFDRRVAAVGGAVGCTQNEMEGPVRERGEQGLARRVPPVEGADTNSGVGGDGGERHSSPFSPDRRCGRGEQAVAVGRCVAAQFTPAGACPVS